MPPSPTRPPKSPNHLAVVWLGALIAASVLVGAVSRPTTHAPVIERVALSAPTEPDPQVLALLARYCLDCHTGDTAEEGVRFDQVHKGDDLDRALLGRMRKMISWEVMPPEEPLPTPDERAALLAWIDDALGAGESGGAIDPGWFTIHRLNRAEYRNTIRDLLGVDPTEHDLSAQLPPDDIGYGFDNIADVLSMSTLQLEAFLDAAERAVELGLGPEVELGDKVRFLRPLSREGNGRPLSRGGHMLYSRGAVGVIHDFPLTGMYELRLRAWANQGGDEYARMRVRLDGKELDTFSVKSEKSGEPDELSLRVRVEAGRHEVSGAFINDFYIPDVADRNLAIVAIGVAGPLGEEGLERPAAFETVFFSRPGGGTPEIVAATEVIERFASRAYRRPVTESELDRLLGLYDALRTDGDTHERSVRTVLEAILVSPSFLYRSVANAAPDNPDRTHELSDHELASRLSYFLWSTMPDEELRRAADLGQLRHEPTLLAQVRRMLADPRSEAFIENFAGQWLLLRNLEDLRIDPERYPSYDAQLRGDMVAEATRFFADIVRSDRSVLDLIDSDDAFLNERLARHYGIEGIEGDQLRRVQLDEASVRGGVMTTGAVLTVTSNPTRTSPVKRGLWVLDQLLGTPPPPPPPDIPPLVKSQETVGEDASLREQLAAHVSEATCRACHRRMDPIGLAMENFDAIGRWRTEAYGGPIDAHGELPGGVVFTGPVELKRILLARDAQFVENLCGRVLTYALGRGLEDFDQPTLDRITARVRDSGDRFGALIEGVVLSEAFRSCRARSD